MILGPSVLWACPCGCGTIGDSSGMGCNDAAPGVRPPGSSPIVLVIHWKGFPIPFPGSG